MQHMRVVQARYMLKYRKMKKNWAMQFKKNFEQAVIDYKSEKRKAFEVQAGQSMSSVLKRHTFRNKLACSIKSREQVVKFFYNGAWITKLRKFLVSHILAHRI
jgi:hypothetical protein